MASAQTPDPSVPKSFQTLGGHYQLLKKLGEGAFGVVYLARHELLDQEFAVKVLKPELCEDPSTRERFLDEARALIRFSHGNVVQLRHVGEQDGRLYLVMDLVKGTPLDELLQKEGALEETRAVSVILQVLAGLEAAHAAGIVHRDLKPANLILEKKPNGQEHVRVLDFGLSRLSAVDGASGARRSVTGTIIGTLAYMSPEQLSGEKEIDGRSDVFAAGLILHELLQGSHPYPGESGIVVAAKLLRDPVPPLDPKRAAKLRPEVRAALARALERDRDARFGSAFAFAQALEGRGPPSDTSRITTIQEAKERLARIEAEETRSRKAETRKKKGLLVGALVAVLAAGGAAFVMMGKSGDAPKDGPGPGPVASVGDGRPSRPPPTEPQRPPVTPPAPAEPSRPPSPPPSEPAPPEPPPREPTPAEPEAAVPAPVEPEPAAPTPSEPGPVAPEPSAPANPEPATPEAGTPGPGTPEAGTPEAGTPEAGTPEPAAPTEHAPTEPTPTAPAPAEPATFPPTPTEPSAPSPAAGPLAEVAAEAARLAEAGRWFDAVKAWRQVLLSTAYDVAALRAANDAWHAGAEALARQGRVAEAHAALDAHIRWLKETRQAYEMRSSQDREGMMLPLGYTMMDMGRAHTDKARWHRQAGDQAAMEAQLGEAADAYRLAWQFVDRDGENSWELLLRRAEWHRIRDDWPKVLEDLATTTAIENTTVPDHMWVAHAQGLRRHAEHLALQRDPNAAYASAQEGLKVIKKGITWMRSERRRFTRDQWCEAARVALMVGWLAPETEDPTPTIGLMGWYLEQAALQPARGWEPEGYAESKLLALRAGLAGLEGKRLQIQRKDAEARTRREEARALALEAIRLREAVATAGGERPSAFDYMVLGRILRDLGSNDEAARAWERARVARAENPE
jgi:serine/threonine-protein kinase